MSNQDVGRGNTMNNFQASLVTTLANATIISALVLGIGFMLRFLLALTSERKTGLAGFRLEYRVNSSLPNATTGPQTRSNRSEGEYDHVGFFSGTPQALKEVALSREYRFTDSSWQEPNRA
jgi:hypothetical protein